MKIKFIPLKCTFGGPHKVIPFDWCSPRYLPDVFPLKNKFIKNHRFRKGEIWGFAPIEIMDNIEKFVEGFEL